MSQQIAENESKPVVTLVVDTNPFVKGLNLDAISNQFVTVSDVYKELRSRAAKDRYQDLDLRRGIKIMEPDQESIQAVSRFAKRTGDLASLAMADIKVIALAFMLEKQKNGMKSLRTEPVKEGNPDISDKKLLETANSNQRKEEEEEEDGQVEELEEKLKDMAVKEVEEEEEDDDASDVLQSTSATDRNEFEVRSDEEKEKETETVDDDGWEVAGSKRNKQKKQNRTDHFFGGGWITPQNVKKHQARNAMGMNNSNQQQPDGEEEEELLDVACVTSDFAMQNVMLKMGINLITPDGVRVTRLRTWVLRCHACGQLTGDMDKQFCGSCGHPTLKRCSVTVGSDGRLQVHLKQSYQHNLRGTIFSMPKTKGGQHTKRDVITRATDKTYMRAMRYKKIRDAKMNSGMSGSNSLFDPDYIPDLLVGGGSTGDTKGYGLNTDARGMPMVARNRRNPNEVRRTGNRKNKQRYD